MDPVLIAILFFVIGGIIISVIATASEIKKHRPVKQATDVEQYIIPGKAAMETVQDSFLRTNVQKRRIAQSNQQGGQPPMGAMPRQGGRPRR